MSSIDKRVVTYISLDGVVVGEYRLFITPCVFAVVWDCHVAKPYLLTKVAGASWPRQVRCSTASWRTR